MEVSEKREVEAFFPQAMAWLDNNPGIRSSVRDPATGEIAFDRVWELAAMLRLSYIKGRVDERNGADYPAAVA